MATQNRCNVLATLLGRRSWPSALARLQTHPQEASTELTRGVGTSLPLHEACKLQPPANIIRKLVDAYPPAVRRSGPFGCLPLHIALKAGASPEVVEILIAEHLPSARIREPTGKLPLHIACQYGASPNVVNVVLINHPQAIVVKDDDGHRPVEYATRQKFCPNQEAEVVRVLDRAKWYCAVSDAALKKVKTEHNSRLRVSEAGRDRDLANARAEGEEQAQLSAEAEATARSEAQAAAAEVERLTKALQVFVEREEKEMRGAEAAREKMWAEREMEKRQSKDLERRLKACEAELAEREGRHAQREGELVATLTNLEDTIQIVTAEAKQLKVKMQSQETLSSVVVALEGRLEESADERDNLQKKSKGLDLSVKRLERELKQARNQNKAGEEEINALKKENQDLEEELEVVMSDKEILDNELTTANEENKIRWDAADMLLTRVKELEKEMEMVTAASREESLEYELRIKGLESMLDQASDRAERGVADRMSGDSEERGGHVEGRDDTTDMTLGGGLSAASSGAPSPQRAPATQRQTLEGDEIMTTGTTESKVKMPRNNKSFNLFTGNDQSWVGSYISP
mmetsp:Transcript_29813/g.88499  ORF Transcript_29813/g.88499 Transcript_29813/m.88499 type:complete len:576 (-) Transcript_29813:315-2042(-)